MSASNWSPSFGESLKLRPVGAAWVPLLGALQAERASRLARGRKPTRVSEANGDVP